MKALSKKTSLKKAFGNLAQVGVLIADGDRRIAAIVREVMESLGFSAIHIVHDGTEAIKVMKTEKIDMLITDWRMTPMDGISLVKYLRHDKDSPNRFLPIIMLTGYVGKEHVEIARDVGVTEFVVKPFSAKTLCDRIILLIDNPRGFVMNQNFVGPDRRRRHILPPDKTEKRHR
ncbi:MAG TPA: response regulator [Rickettsiales bacterium]|nr:response regulator [Rickettsiales bacterium]